MILPSSVFHLLRRPPPDRGVLARDLCAPGKPGKRVALWERSAGPRSSGFRHFCLSVAARACPLSLPAAGQRIVGRGRRREVARATSAASLPRRAKPGGSHFASL